MEFKRIEEEIDKLEAYKSNGILSAKGSELLTELHQALQFKQAGVSGSNFTLEQIILNIKEVGLTNNNTSRFGEGYEKAINDVLLKFQNKCKKCGKNIDKQFRYCSIECKNYYYR